jgi:5-methyltetrahydrofolate--homocysteine methyltransferase
MNNFRGDGPGVANEANGVIILDGATGTELMKRGMPSGVATEKWVLENPGIFAEIQKNYIAAGSQAVYAPTFGANAVRLKKSETFLGSTYDINMKLLEISRAAVGNNARIGGDMSPSGDFLYPMGELTEDKLIEAYKEQVRAFHDFQVDFIVIETMMDIREVKCALLACYEVYKKPCPVYVTVTLEENGKMLSGTDPLTALLIAQNYGASAFGFNCSTGPSKMRAALRDVYPYARIPLIAKPNAGMPAETRDGLVFDMDAAEFTVQMKGLIEEGATILGGCCGTSPEYIKGLCEIKDYAPVLPGKKLIRYASSARKTVIIDENTTFDEFELANGADIYDALLDSESDIIKITVNCGDDTLIDLLSKLNMTVFTPVIFEINAERKEIIKRMYTGVSNV